MAQKLWLPQDGTAGTVNCTRLTKGEPISICATRNGLGSGWGHLVESAIIEFTELSGEAISSYIGFKEASVFEYADHNIPAASILQGDPLGSIKHQVAFDGVATWKYWNGTAFVAATTSDHWNTDVQMSTGLATITSGTIYKKIKFRTKITTSQDASPKLYSISLFYELRYDFDESMMRSVKKFIEANVSIRSYYKQQLAAASSTVTISHPLTVTGVTAAFNTTTDPNKEVNIYLSRSGNVVTLTSAQVLGSIIEVVFTGTAPVLLSAEPESNEGDTPAVLIVFRGFSEIKREREDKLQREYKGNHEWYGLRTAPKKVQFDIDVHCPSSRKLIATALANSVSSVFSDEFLNAHPLNCLSSGEPIEIYNLVPTEVRDLPTENLFDSIVKLSGSCWDWSSTVSTNVHRVDVIDLGFGTTENYIESTEVRA